MKPVMQYGWIAVAAMVLGSLAGPVPAAESQGLTNLFFPFDSGVGRGKWTPAEQAQCAKEMGFDGIGYNYIKEKPELLDQWRKELGQRGRKLIDIYVAIPWPKKPGERGWDYLREPIRKLKGTQTVLWAPIWGRQHTDLDDAVAVKILNEIADWCQESGIRLCLYAHLNAYTDTADDCLRLARKVGRPGVVGVSINLAHERPGGNSERLVQFPREMAPYLMMVSINGSDRQKGGILPLGQGDFDIYPFLKALDDIGYQGPIGIQCFQRQGDIRENLANDMKQWRQWNARLAKEPKPARPPQAAAAPGGLILAGDAAFDSDQIASADLQNRCWLSYPGGRLCLNPASKRGFALKPMAAELPWNIGGYLGTGVLRLDHVLEVRMADQSKEPEASSSRYTTWSPYKLAFSASFANRMVVSGYDFFADANSTLIRVLKVRGSGKKEVCLSGNLGGSAVAAWDEAKGVIVVKAARYAYALQIAQLSGTDLAAQPLRLTPVIEEGAWSVRIPVEGPAVLGVSFGFAADVEGPETAISRATAAFARPVTVSLAEAKATMDGYLRRIPQPTGWGIEGVAVCGVTPARHRQAYYAAWTLVIQSVMNSFPENKAYPYPQMSLGKPSLWAEGEHTSPATCGWESFLGLQWFSLLEPEICWKAYQGIMSRVDHNGRLGGESLPSRKAQTAWILYQRKPDREKLSEVYPAIKRYLLWREQNPRWIYGGNNATDEKDTEFAVSWLLDVNYAIRIAGELGQTEDVGLWKTKAAEMRKNVHEWFFSDPKELHQFYFTKRKVYATKERSEYRPVMILTALSLDEVLPDDFARLTRLFREIHKPDQACDGFAYTKYADNNLLAYGLLDRGMPEARPFLESLLRDSIRAGEFGEVLRPGPKGAPEAEGVKPSLFNALNVIEFTWMLNGVRYESGVSTVEGPVSTTGARVQH